MSLSAKRVAQPEGARQGATRRPIVRTMSQGSNAAAGVPGRNRLGPGAFRP
jgi:hypothetical protein